MGKKRLLPLPSTNIEQENSSFSSCKNVEYEIIDERFQNDHRSKQQNGSNSNNSYELRSGTKKARLEKPDENDMLRDSPFVRRSRRSERISESNGQLITPKGLNGNTNGPAIGRRKENNNNGKQTAAAAAEKNNGIKMDGQKGNERGKLETKEAEKKEEEEEGTTAQSSSEEEDEEEEEKKHQKQQQQEEEEDDSVEEEQNELNRRYSFRRNREKFSNQREHRRGRRPMRSCRLESAQSVAFVSDVCKKYNNNNSSTRNSFEAAAGIPRLPSNPVLDRRHSKYEKRRHRHRRLDRCSSSSSSGSTSDDSSSTSVNGGGEGTKRNHSMRKDLKDEANFEQRKLKSLLKGRQELMPINLSGKDIQTNLAQMAREKVRQTNTKSSCADIDPMHIELDTGFKQVGGLTQHIHSLKEIVLFPMLYSHLFERFKIQPPKGILFHGPPGTGKTLLARALARECDQTGAGKIAFFMRKGADCLSKWVGESERQLRLLFDQAFRMRPSIIFFDEVDGLAPVRTSRQDQIHSSIVSTLLALMDGLDARGEVIVIGATNRLDSIDPALRRPGRFDRELAFELPDANGRRAILRIHTEPWGESRPDEELLDWLAEQTSGYCGADLKALCTESVLVAMRECFPHMYISSEKLKLDPAKIRIKKTHFSDALHSVKPSAKRASPFHAQMPGHCCRVSFIDTFVDHLVAKCVPRGYSKRQNLDNLYETELERVVLALKTRPIVPNARLLLHGHGPLGQSTHFLPVLVNRVDHLPLFCLSVETIFAGPATPEENIAQIVGRALRTVGQHGSVQALMLLPDLDMVESVLPTGTWKMLISSLNAFSGFVSVLLFASVQKLYTQCSHDIQQLFNAPNSFVEIKPPDRSEITKYFDSLFEGARKKPMRFDLRDYPTPPKAKIEESVTRKFTASECAELEKDYQQMLRQFRIFLRDLLRQIIREPRFKCFHLPVDKTDAEDYYEIVKQPMCLSQMMGNIDLSLYASKDAFAKDIQLIRNNAIEYNPDTDMDSKQIRHAANALVDMTEALFSMEMDDDFPTKLEEARKLVEEAKRWTEKMETAEKDDGTENGGREKNIVPSTVEEDERRGEVGTETQRQFDDEGHSGGKKKGTDRSPTPPAFILDMEQLQDVVKQATDKARICSWGVPQIECLGVQLCQIVDQFSGEWDRSELIEKMKKCVDAFVL
ncbi:hypothetical protein niasHT_033877 [Heterodera trifolii]|uniref:Bromo domain-containing protein n=1 Tax=Heterodera trifolii TaxID=157864 RepID=A0ABD2IPR7_9BILA